MKAASLTLLALLAVPGPARAETVACLTSIAGTDIALTHDTADPGVKASRSLRERLFGGYGRITCPAQITLRAMTPDLTDPQRQPFCLIWDGTAATYAGFQTGPRDAWGECQVPSGRFCNGVNASTEVAADVAGALTRAALGTPASGEGATVIDRASGAVIATGGGGWLASTLGSAGSAALAARSAPAVAGAAAVTVVAVGGAVYVCGE